MTKKKKQTQTILPAKRKSFGIIFLQKWIPILIISIIICALAFTIFVSHTKNQLKDNFYYVHTQNSDKVLNLSDTTDETEYANALSWFMVTCYGAYGIPSLLFDTATDEIIAGCEEQLFFIVLSPDADIRVFAYPTSNIPEWAEYNKKCKALNTTVRSTYYEIYMPYHYINGANFIPGPLTVYTYSYNFGYIPEGETQEDAIFTTTITPPNEIPEEYEKQQYSNAPVTPVVASGYHPDSPYPIYPYSKASYLHLMDSYKNPPIEIDSSCSFYNENFFSLEMVYCTPLTGMNGKSVILMTAIDYDAPQAHRSWLITISIAVIILGLLLAFLLARMSYARLTALYDMEDYRKTLMNTLAHDLKSPLMSISGYAENLYNNINTDKHQHYSEAIIKNVYHMKKIIDSILLLNKTENTAKLTLADVNITDTIQECLRKYELQIEEKNLSINLDGNVTLSADNLLLTQALDNLIGNAIKYSPYDSTIKITIDSECITFENHCDNEINVDISTLCKPFVVGDTSRNNTQGNGLGLTIVKKICELHGFSFKINHENKIFNAQIKFK